MFNFFFTNVLSRILRLLITKGSVVCNKKKGEGNRRVRKITLSATLKANN